MRTFAPSQERQELGGFCFIGEENALLHEIQSKVSQSSEVQPETNVTRNLPRGLVSFPRAELPCRPFKAPGTRQDNPSALSPLTPCPSDSWDSSLGHPALGQANLTRAVGPCAVNSATEHYPGGRGATSSKNGLYRQPQTPGMRAHGTRPLHSQ